MKRLGSSRSIEPGEIARPADPPSLRSLVRRAQTGREAATAWLNGHARAVALDRDGQAIRDDQQAAAGCRLVRWNRGCRRWGSPHDVQSYKGWPIPHHARQRSTVATSVRRNTLSDP